MSLCRGHALPSKCSYYVAFPVCELCATCPGMVFCLEVFATESNPGISHTSYNMPSPCTCSRGSRRTKADRQWLSARRVAPSDNTNNVWTASAVTRHTPILAPQRGQRISTSRISTSSRRARTFLEKLCCCCFSCEFCCKILVPPPRSGRRGSRRGNSAHWSAVRKHACVDRVTPILATQRGQAQRISTSRTSRTDLAANFSFSYPSTSSSPLTFLEEYLCAVG